MQLRQQGISFWAKYFLPWHSIAAGWRQSVGLAGLNNVSGVQQLLKCHCLLSPLLAGDDPGGV